MTMLAGSVLAGTLAVAGVSGVADASSVHKTAKHQHQTTKGDRPYGGIAPKGMSEKQYAELERDYQKQVKYQLKNIIN